MTRAQADERAFAALRELGPTFSMMGRIFSILGAAILGVDSLDELEARVRPELARPPEAAAPTSAMIGSVQVNPLAPGAIAHILGEE